jgi:lysophospholipase L1-like esterase
MTRARLAALAAVVVAAGALLVSPQAAVATTLQYVALGDSSAAGPLIPTQIDAACTRSDHNWPHVVAVDLGASLTDVTCSGAKIADLSGRQFGFVAPQLDAVTADTDLVTIAISANDINMGAVVPSCLNPLPDPGLAYCKNFYVVNGVDSEQQAINASAPKLGAALDAIHARAPQAKVVVVGYLTYYQPGGCWPVDPVWGQDANYIQQTFDSLMSMMRTQAAAHGASYVDIRTPSTGHGVAGTDKWVEGTLATSPAFLYHPNAKGMAAAGHIISAAVS